MDQQCIFKFRYKCDETTPLTKNAGMSWIETIMRASKVYGDILHEELQSQLKNDNRLMMWQCEWGAWYCA